MNYRLRHSPAYLLAGLLLLLTPLPTAQAQSASVAVAPNPAPQNSDLVIELAGFQPRESIAVWLTLPDGQVVPINDLVVAMNAEQYEARADERGAVSIHAIIDWSFPTGSYAFSARGNLSAIEAVAPFTLTPAPPSPLDPQVALSVDYGRSEGETVLRFGGSGFAGSEAVALWVTRPDNTVLDLGLVQASAGTWSYEVPAASIGGTAEHTLTAAGTSSGRRNILAFVPQP